MSFADAWTEDSEESSESTKRSSFREKVASPKPESKKYSGSDLRKLIQGKMKAKRANKKENNLRLKISTGCK